DYLVTGVQTCALPSSVPHLTKDLLFALILPGLIFEAAFNLDAREFWRNRLAIGALAVPGVVVAVLLTAAIVSPALAAVRAVGDWIGRASWRERGEVST